MADGQVTHTVDLANCLVVVKHVPAKVCTQCGEVWYTGVVTKQLERIVDAITATIITEIAIVNYSDKVA